MCKRTEGSCLRWWKGLPTRVAPSEPPLLKSPRRIKLQEERISDFLHVAPQVLVGRVLGFKILIGYDA